MRILLSTIVLASIFLSTKSVAQCTVDPSQTTPGVYPNVLESGCANSTYSDTSTIVFNADTVVAIPVPPFNVTVPLDSVIITGYSNIPAGLNASCGSATCTAYPVGPGAPAAECILIDGTPSAAVTNNVIQVYFTAWLTVPIVGVQSVQDSIQISISIGSNSSSTQLITTCNPYTWSENTTTYTTSGLDSVTIPNALGCDSVITLDLTINAATFSSISETVCDTYTVPSGNSTYTISGNYQDTIPNTAGCDSIISISLLVNTAPINTVTETGGTLTADASGVTYQWLDCDNGMVAIAGANNQSYSGPTGNYAVEVHQPLGMCSDTSACFSVVVGLEENSFGSLLEIYPNPTEGNIQISLGEIHAHITISVYAISGQLIDRHSYNSTDVMEISIDGDSGFYFLEATSDTGESVKVKVLKW